MDDDDWIEEDQATSGKPQGGAADPLVHTQWERITTRYSDAGYREGITPGKLSTLQQGFDQAFALSVAPSRELGLLRGRASALLALAQSRADASPQLVPDIRAFIQRLAAVKRTDILPRDLEAEAHAREEHGGDGVTAMDEGTQHQRDVEGLEAMMAGIHGANVHQQLRESVLLADLRRQLDQLRQSALGSDAAT